MSNHKSIILNAIKSKKICKSKLNLNQIFDSNLYGYSFSQNETAQPPLAQHVFVLLINSRKDYSTTRIGTLITYTCQENEKPPSNIREFHSIMSQQQNLP